MAAVTSPSTIVNFSGLRIGAPRDRPAKSADQASGQRF
jgi:hypothetical protein